MRPLGGSLRSALLDQIAYTWVSSPLGVELELLCLDWLKELFGLRPELAGVMTTGASMANLVGLAVARQWWGERLGVDIAEEGFGELPPVPVLTSGYIHSSAIKELGLLMQPRGHPPCPIRMEEPCRTSFPARR